MPGSTSHRSSKGSSSAKGSKSGTSRGTSSCRRTNSGGNTKSKRKASSRSTSATREETRASRRETRSSSIKEELSRPTRRSSRVTNVTDPEERDLRDMKQQRAYKLKMAMFIATPVLVLILVIVIVVKACSGPGEIVEPKYIIEELEELVKLSEDDCHREIRKWKQSQLRKVEEKIQIAEDRYGERALKPYQREIGIIDSLKELSPEDLAYVHGVDQVLEQFTLDLREARKTTDDQEREDAIQALIDALIKVRKRLERIRRKHPKTWETTSIYRCSRRIDQVQSAIVAGHRAKLGGAIAPDDQPGGGTVAPPKEARPVSDEEFTELLQNADENVNTAKQQLEQAKGEQDKENSRTLLEEAKRLLTEARMGYVDVEYREDLALSDVQKQRLEQRRDEVQELIHECDKLLPIIGED